MLWTFILFNGWVEAENISQELDCARAWLSRSGQLPLTILVDSNADESYITAVFQLLAPHCARWREIELPALHMHRDSMSPQLKDGLALLNSADVHHIMPGELADALMRAPRLQRLRVQLDSEDPIHLVCSVIPVSLQWIQLTHLELGGCLSPSMHAMVALALNVIWLKVLVRRCTSLSGPELKIVTHPSISVLIISSPYYNGGPMEQFLYHLILPELRQMTLNQPHRSVISLVTRSACTLSSLNIETPD